MPARDTQADEPKICVSVYPAHEPKSFISRVIRCHPMTSFGVQCQTMSHNVLHVITLYTLLAMKTMEIVPEWNNFAYAKLFQGRRMTAMKVTGALCSGMRPGPAHPSSARIQDVSVCPFRYPPIPFGWLLPTPHNNASLPRAGLPLDLHNYTSLPNVRDTGTRCRTPCLGSEV
jgi:hypothetical protein